MRALKAFVEMKASGSTSGTRQVTLMLLEATTALSHQQTS
jgi:hypothetical protein